jgi:hypothetical protein
MNVGYSGTPLAKKLGIKPHAKVWVSGSQNQLRNWLDDDTIEYASEKDAIDVAIIFCLTPDDMEREWAAITNRVVDRGGIWIAWPKKASKVATELDDNVVRMFGLSTGWVDNKVCAISEVWSGLRFVRRLK